MTARPQLARRLAAIVAATLIGALFLATPAEADDTRAKSWQLDYLHIDQAHQISTGQDVIVAVVDSGVNSDQPELSGHLLTGTDPGMGYTGNGQGDGDGHGTAMATLIAGHGYGTNNADGVLGIAPGVKILPINDTGGQADPNENAANGVSWAVDHGATVISLSLAGTRADVWEPALAKAIAHDVVVVGGMGNRTGDSMDVVEYPAKYPGVLAVTANDRNGHVPAWAITGPRTDITAPGMAIPAPDLNHKYPLWQGTSLSTAIVAGVAALIRAKYPKLSAKEVVHRIEATADDKGDPGKDETYGYGIVNPVQALTADVPPLDSSASPTAHAAPGRGRANPGLWVLAGVVVLVLLGAGGVFVVKIRR